MTSRRANLAVAGLTPYAPIPLAILEMKELTFAAKCLLAAIIDLTPNKDGWRRASLAFLAKQIGGSRNTAREARAKAGRCGLLQFEQRSGRRSAYKVHAEPTPYAPLPYAILETKDLTFAAKCLLAAIIDLTPNKDGWRRASLAFLAKQIGGSRNTARRAQAQAGRRGLLQFQQRAGRRTGYKLHCLNYQDANKGYHSRTPEGVENGTPGGGENGTPGGQKWDPRGSKMVPPLASRTLITYPSTPGGVPPQVWSELVLHLQSTYAATWGPNAMPPCTWYDAMRKEAQAGNVELIRGITTADMELGYLTAKAKNRSYGFGWVRLAAHERQIAATLAQRTKEAVRASQAANKRILADSPQATEQSAAQERSARQITHFNALPTDRRDNHLAAVRVTHPGVSNENLLISMAATLAAESLTEGS